MKDLIALTSSGFLDKKRYIVNEGGTRSAKTYSTLQVLFHIANSRKTLISVVSETMPHLRRGAIKDFKDILIQMRAWNPSYWNKTNSTYEIPDRGTIEFFSADSPDKVHGPARNILFINEGQNISYEIVRHLFVRTTGTIFIDFNPTREFWAHTEIKDDPRCLWIHSTYKDNPFLSEEQVFEIEKNKKNKTWWAIYGEGKIAESEGAVYNGWKFIDSIPKEARLVRYGLDFGYTNDPSALIAVYKYNGGIILDEVIYRKRLLNSQIAKLIKQEPPALIIADGAEPKSIDELQIYDIDIIAAVKGQGSILQGIQAVQNRDITVTKSSTNLIKEYRNYLWKIDKDGKALNVPEDIYNHCFIGSTQIKMKCGYKDIKDIKIGDSVFTSYGYRKVLKKHNNGIKLVKKYKLQLDTHTVILVCTPDHKIKTGDVWTEVSKLKSGMMVTLISHSMGKSFTYIQEKDIFLVVLKECIQRFGDFIKVKLKMVITYTIKMVTLGIIELKILKKLRKTDISQNTVKKGLEKIQNGLRSFNKWALLKLQSGINLKKELNGILNMVKELGIIESIKRLFVKCVEKNIKQLFQQEANTVIKTVKLKRCEEEGSWREKVYDLTIDSNHEYYANNVCVHNCMDAVRYAITDLYPVEDELEKPKDTRLKGTYVPYSSKEDDSGSFYEDYSPTNAF